MNGTRIRVCSSRPCPICGSTDYDMIMDYGVDGAVVWCHHLNYTGVVAGNDGKTYVCIKEGKESRIGTFNLFKDKQLVDAEKQAWIEEQKRNNPGWKNYTSYPGHKRADRSKTETSSIPMSPKPAYDVKRLSNKELDLRYRYFLSLLVLEKKHEAALRKEWMSGVYPDIADIILSHIPLRSMPPADSVRYSLNERFSNPSRKQIVRSMQKRFGSLIGIPGFYMREGAYWDSQPEEERWTFAGAEGIIFPMYDIEQHIVGLRIRLDYPDVKVKDTDAVLYHGKHGTFSHGYRDGKSIWYFTKAGEKESIEALDVPLKNNIPAIGKISSKYRPFSSWKDKNVDGHTINAYKNGISSGSPYSIYYPVSKEKRKYKFVFLTEGEKKGIVTAQIKKNPCVSFSGVGLYRGFFEPDESGKSCFEKLCEEGVEYFIIAYDADKDGNEAVAFAEEGLAEEILKNGGTPLIGEWNHKFQKGIDDILLMGIDLNVRQYKKREKH